MTINILYFPYSIYFAPVICIPMKEFWYRGGDDEKWYEVPWVPYQTMQLQDCQLTTAHGPFF